MFRYRRVLSVLFLFGVFFFLQYLFPSPVFAACSGTFCGEVFIDGNGNGVLDSGEQNYTGATVTLNSANGTDVESQQTTSTGYSFSPNVCIAGTYTVTVTVPSGYNATTSTAGSGSIAVGLVQSGFGSCASHPLKCSTQQYCTPVNGTCTNCAPQPTICIPQTVCFQDTTVWNHRNPIYSPNTINFGIKLITYSISGNVSDNNNAGVPGVNVTVNGNTIKTDANGNYSVSNLVPASYTVSITVPLGYIANGATSQAVTLNANKTGINFKLTKVFQIAGTVYNDTNEDGKLDNRETGYQGITVKITNGSGTQTITSDANGDYSFQINSTAGNSTITISNIPAGWFNTTITSQTVASNINTTGLNFGIAQENTVSGNVFVDLNKNGIKDAGENNYAVTPSINANGGTVTKNADGSYTVSNLLPGTYMVSYNFLPINYYITSPLNGPPPSFAITVGSGCSVNGAPGATCTNGNITNLSFGISNTYPWFQASCGDIRNDNGINDYLPDYVPLGQFALITNATCPTSPLAFTGSSDPFFGQGQASATNQVVGGSSYPEVFSSTVTLATAYPSLLIKAQDANIIPTDLATVCTLSNCTLPNNLAHGIYLATGDVTLNTDKFQNNNNYIFLINGTLTLNGDITVPNSSTALFSTTKNIVVAATVGSAANATASSLDGWFIAGQNFLVNSQGNCNDLRLNIGGSVVVNALGSGGTFQNTRDLCGNDAADPTISVAQRLDMILNAPQFIKQQLTISQEVAP